MPTLEKLKEHVSQTKTKVKEAAQKAGDFKYDPDLRKTRKKYKRLSRKAAKLIFFEKNAELKKKPKKERKAASEG